MPTEIFFSAGGSVKVTADIEDVFGALIDGARILDTHRFAGFRGDEAVAGERIVVVPSAVAYALAIAAP